MGDINQQVGLTIIANAQSATRANFGTPAFAAYHTKYLDLIRTYNSLAGVVADGFAVTDPTYLAAQAILEQNPTTSSFKIIRLSSTSNVTQTFTFTFTDLTIGKKNGLTVLGPDGVVHDLYVTSSGTLATDATALAALSLPTHLSASASGAVVTFTAAAGFLFYPQLLPADSTAFGGGFQGGTFADTTGTTHGTLGAAVVTDLTAARSVDSNWYGVGTQWIDDAVITAVAAYGASTGVEHWYVTANSSNRTSGSGIGNALKLTSNKYSIGLYSQSPAAFPNMGWMAGMFVLDPGTYTADAKNIVGAIPDDNLTPTELGNLATNQLNYYTTTAGLEVTYNGLTGGNNWFEDLTRGLDALSDDIKKSLFTVKASVPKVSYTSKGIQSFASALAASLKRFTATDSDPNKLLSNDSGFQPVVLVPQIKDAASADKKARILRNLNFTATIAGAIQTIKIVGTVSF